MGRKGLRQLQNYSRNLAYIVAAEYAILPDEIDLILWTSELIAKSISYQVDCKIMVTRRESIALFLKAKARPDLADLYHPGMEVQVNVAQDGGERIEGEYNGHNWSGWTDGMQVWKPIRIPFNSMTDPHYEDSEIKFDLVAHAEGIGMTGFDFANHRSVYCAYDFDAICGHSEKHAKKLSDTELTEVRELACKIPWVTVRQSTSGSGLHLYVNLQGITGIKNHVEHAAVARSILGKMGAITGFDFNAKVDNCGGNIWIWHRKFESAGGINGPGLKLIKQGEPLSDIPINWRDHIRVTSGAKRKSKPGFVEETEVDWFEEMCGQYTKVPLDAEHKKLIEFLEGSGSMWWFDNDHHMLVCHTFDLARAHSALSMRGLFKTLATGRQSGGDQNCYAHPQRKGSWVVRRHTKGVAEAPSWEQDASGWTRCYLNKDPDLKIAARSYGGIENDKGAFVFRSAELAVQAAAALGANIDMPNFVAGRSAKLKAHKDGRLIFEIDRNSGDQSDKMQDWIEERGNVWKRVINTQISASTETELGNYDDVVRHLITTGGEDYGWVVKSDNIWCKEPYHHVKLALGSFGVSAKDVAIVMGQLIVKRWTIVNKPFQPEYPGDRQWNKNAAQLAYAPSVDVDHSKYPTWSAMLKHCGTGLDEAISQNQWCKDNGIIHGGDYLKCWIASLFQFPLEHLPYLFFFGPQSSGKTTFSEAVGMLMTRGVMRADAALINQSGFNGELESKVLCTVEETDLRHNKSSAYNRIKDWVTNDTILIHQKGQTPYTVVNSTHWIHNSNDQEECPIFPGDTRITMCYVPPLERLIPKSDLMKMLQKEAPEFLAAILTMELPKSCDRNNVPVIATEEKKRAEKLNQTELEQFLEETTYPVQGEWLKVSDLHDKFQEWLDPDRVTVWTKIKMNRELLRLGYTKGRSSKDKGQFFIGNISWTPRNPGEVVKPRLVLSGEMLVPEGTM